MGSICSAPRKDNNDPTSLDNRKAGRMTKSKKQQLGNDTNAGPHAKMVLDDQSNKKEFSTTAFDDKHANDTTKGINKDDVITALDKLAEKTEDKAEQDSKALEEAKQAEEQRIKKEEQEKIAAEAAKAQELAKLQEEERLKKEQEAKAAEAERLKKEKERLEKEEAERKRKE
jgi:hypothetical protein